MNQTGWRYFLADVFADGPFRGNPLAVFPDAAGIPKALRQRLARELNLSETSFVLTAFFFNDTATTEIYTPLTEIPFAGHPCLGTAHVLQTLGRAGPALCLSTGAGPVQVRTVGDRLELRAPRAPARVNHRAAREALPAILGLARGDIVSCDAWTCGLPFVLVEAASQDAVDRAVLHQEAWRSALAGGEARDIYLFSLHHQGEEALIHARMFSPADGIGEDPATGSAAAALMGWLATRGIRQIEVRQGVALGRPSAITARIENGSVHVAGSVVRVGEGLFYPPPRHASPTDWPAPPG